MISPIPETPIDIRSMTHDVGCIACHVDDDQHDGHFGEACDSCHNDRDWSTLLFDHERDTDHALLGAHASIDCESCHIEPIFEVALLAGCNDCHAADDPHEGEQGTECRDCHNEDSWTDFVFFDHDLTRFPLLGMHADASCGDCHESAVFRKAPEDCVDCHRDIDPHDGRFTAECSACHNPVDWNAWQFDHDLLTDFPLDGAHTSLACNDCHRQPLSAMDRLSDQCGNCHRSDDIHNGEFGPDCGRCHSAENFRDVREIQ